MGPSKYEAHTAYGARAIQLGLIELNSEGSKRQADLPKGSPINRLNNKYVEED